MRVSAKRKCSVLMAAGAGLTVCLSSGNVMANSGSVGETIGFGSGRYIFDNKVLVFYWTTSAMAVNPVGTAQFATNGGHLAKYNAGVSCKTGANWFYSVATNAADTSIHYIKVRYNTTTVPKYGWFESQWMAANAFRIGAWSYNPTGGAILTLSESVTTTKLPLSDGQTKLHWTNANEDGVSRYEVQAQTGDGAWQAVDSSTPGESSYAVKVNQDATYRLMVEMTDGEKHEVAF